MDWSKGYKDILFDKSNHLTHEPKNLHVLIVYNINLQIFLKAHGNFCLENGGWLVYLLNGRLEFCIKLWRIKSFIISMYEILILCTKI